MVSEIHRPGVGLASWCVGALFEGQRVVVIGLVFVHDLGLIGSFQRW